MNSQFTGFSVKPTAAMLEKLKEREWSSSESLALAWEFPGLFIRHMTRPVMHDKYKGPEMLAKYLVFPASREHAQLRELSANITEIEVFIINDASGAQFHRLQMYARLHVAGKPVDTYWIRAFIDNGGYTSVSSCFDS